MKVQETQIYELEYYIAENGKAPLVEWMRRLDNTVKAKLTTKIDNLSSGNFGNCKSLGRGLYELKIEYGSGYRVYYSQIGKKVLLLIMGGDKGSQKKDIKNAALCLEAYHEN